MTTLNPQELTHAIDALKSAASRAIKTDNADEFELVERRLNQFDATLRELQQKLWASEAKAAIRKLESQKALDEDEISAVRAFLVSDAEEYLQHENNFGDWQREMERLFAEIGRRCQQLDRESVADLRGVVRDLLRLVPDIRNYLDEKMRVGRFTSALHSLDAQARETLIKLMREQLADPRM